MQFLRALSAERIFGLVLLLTCTLSSKAQDRPIPPPEPNGSNAGTSVCGRSDSGPVMKKSIYL
jgi:hypothetical protein